MPRPLRVPEHVSLCESDPPSATADERGSWKLSFVLARDVSPDERLWLCVHGGRNMKMSWAGLQADDPRAEGYVGLSDASGGRLSCVGKSEDGGIFSFAVPASGFRQGEQLAAQLGGETGTVAQKFTQACKFFLLVTASPDEELQPPNLWGETLNRVVGACGMPVVGGPIADIRVIAPSTAVIGEPISLVVRPEDRNRNVASTSPGELAVRLNGDQIATCRVEIEGSNCCRLEGVVLPDAGIHRLEIKDVSSGLTAISNPIRCVKPGEPKLLWGSMHSHTEISDGTGTLDEYFTVMRDECAIDFGATADHDKADDTPEHFWAMTCDAVERYNEPGRFTAFLGFEWATWRRRGDGDKNVYYLHDRRPIYRSEDDAYPAPPDLYKALANEDALVMPHHPAHPGNHCDWKDHDPEKERLVEIYSFWGCSERSAEDGNIYIGSPVENLRGVPGVNPIGYVQRGLELGWRIGFTANADDHSGHGSDRIIRHKNGRDFTGGLTGVYAAENTREAIWDALVSRRCCATTGDRMIVDFRLDGFAMGSEIRLSEHPEFVSGRTLVVSVHGADKIASIEIVRNNVDVFTVRPGVPDCEFEWLDMDALEDVNLPPAQWSSVPFTFYYLRVTQENRQIAWASPIWIS